jgi:hypothetical protein
VKQGVEPRGRASCGVAFPSAVQVLKPIQHLGEAALQFAWSRRWSQCVVPFDVLRSPRGSNPRWGCIEALYARVAWIQDYCQIGLGMVIWIPLVPDLLGTDTSFYRYHGTHVRPEPSEYGLKVHLGP